jgi:hypothetical protein
VATYRAVSGCDSHRDTSKRKWKADVDSSALIRVPGDLPASARPSARTTSSLRSTSTSMPSWVHGEPSKEFVGSFIGLR